MLVLISSSDEYDIKVKAAAGLALPAVKADTSPTISGSEEKLIIP